MSISNEKTYKASAAAAAEGLRRYAGRLAEQPVLVGFDGFVDSIISVVDQRADVDEYTAIPTISRYSQKIAAAAGRSSNFEMVVKLEKLGGNGPIMANALASLGFGTTYIGALGYPNVHRVFASFAEQAECHTIAPPGLTDALEFDDGKLMMGKYEHLAEINWQRLCETVGRDKFVDIVRRSRLIGMVNWTMLPGTSDIWDKMVDEVLPEVTAGEDGAPKRLAFIDLADPEKRTRESLREAVDLIGRMRDQVNVAFGMNLKESTQVAEVLGIDMGDDPEAAIEDASRAMLEKLGVHAVVIHPLKSAAAAMQMDGEIRSAHMPAPYVKKPKLSTGAGDNFNAGFCLGLLADLPIDQAVVVGNATSGHYVRNAGSPTLEQTAVFCDDLPMPE